MTMENDKGTIHDDDASKALKYSGGDGWSTMTDENESFVMNFTLLEKCSGNWEIAIMGFKTALVYQILLKIEDDVKRKWVRKLYTNSWVLVIVIVIADSEFLKRYSKVNHKTRLKNERHTESEGMFNKSRTKLGCQTTTEGERCRGADKSGFV